MTTSTRKPTLFEQLFHMVQRGQYSLEKAGSIISSFVSRVSLLFGNREEKLLANMIGQLIGSNHLENAERNLLKIDAIDQGT